MVEHDILNWLSSQWLTFILLLGMVYLYLELKKIKNRAVIANSAVSLKENILHTTLLQKAEILYQLSTAWLDASQRSQQLNYDYLNGRLVIEDYAFHINHLLDETNYDIRQIEMLIQIYFPTLLPQFAEIKQTLKRMTKIFNNYDFDPITSNDLSHFNTQLQNLNLQSTTFKRMLSMQIQQIINDSNQ